uniref:Uncharacterized protein n=1 Tax=Timema cristinae TaxID=61476 RepID=A0A7R9H4Z4_TIMCR|nr:unnamed protein product [Timema cristinae]
MEDFSSCSVSSGTKLFVMERISSSSTDLSLVMLKCLGLPTTKLILISTVDLSHDQVMVLTLQSHQLLMSSLFCYFPIRQCHNLICLTNRRQAIIHIYTDGNKNYNVVYNSPYQVQPALWTHCLYREPRIIESLNELNTSRLATTRAADQCYSFTRVDGQVYECVEREVGTHPTFRTAAEIDCGAEIITSAIKGSLEASTPRHRPKRAPQASLRDSILRHVREKIRLRKAWQILRDPVDKANWSCKVHAVREMVREYRNSVWEDKIESLCVQDRSLWQMTRNLMRVPAPRPPIVSRNGVANSDQEKAGALAEHLGAICTD